MKSASDGGLRMVVVGMVEMHKEIGSALKKGQKTKENGKERVLEEGNIGEAKFQFSKQPLEVKSCGALLNPRSMDQCSSELFIVECSCVVVVALAGSSAAYR